MHDLGDVGVEAVAVRSFGDRPGSDRPAGDLRLARPLRLGALDRIDRGAVQGEPRIPAEIRALARVRHRAEDQLAVLEDRLDPGDPRRPVGSQGGKRLVPVSVEQRPHALRELRLGPFDVPPRRHAPMIAPMTATAATATPRRPLRLPRGGRYRAVAGATWPRASPRPMRVPSGPGRRGGDDQLVAVLEPGAGGPVGQRERLGAVPGQLDQAAALTRLAGR